MNNKAMLSRFLENLLLLISEITITDGIQIMNEISFLGFLFRWYIKGHDLLWEYIHVWRVLVELRGMYLQ